MSTVIILSGNPRENSRTAGAARALAERIAGIAGPAPLVETIELAAVADRVLTPADEVVAALRDRVAAASLVIVATPAYKGSYTGLLKAFFDGYGPHSLTGVTAVPFVVAGSAAHTRVTAEIHLRPLMQEVGANTALGTVAFTEAEVADASAVGAALDAWVAARVPLVLAVLAEADAEGVAA